MNHDQFQQLKEEMMAHVADTMRITVNGKIDKIDRKLDDYIKTDNAWKKEAQPAIDAFINLRGGYKTLLLLSGLIIAIGAAMGMIRGWIKL